MAEFTTFSFWDFYILGVFAYWFNSLYVVVKSVRLIVRWKDLTEKEGRKLDGT